MIHKSFTIAKVCNVYFLKTGIIFLQEYLKILSHDFLNLYLNFLGQQFLNLPSFCISEAGQKLQKKNQTFFFSFAHYLSLMDTKRHISDPEQDPIESSHGTSVT